MLTRVLRGPPRTDSASQGADAIPAIPYDDRVQATGVSPVAFFSFTLNTKFRLGGRVYWRTAGRCVSVTELVFGSRRMGFSPCHYPQDQAVPWSDCFVYVLPAGLRFRSEGPIQCV